MHDLATPPPASSRCLPGVPTSSERMHGGERWIGIDDVDGMPPFFTTAVGDNECWLFAGSNGPLCAGRRDPELALFPYVNADRILDHARSVGFLSCLQLDGGRLWEPWSDQPALHPRQRSLHRHELGAGLLFSESDLESGLELAAELATCQRFGLVRRVALTNRGTRAVRVRVLDGFHRLVPPGVGTATWASYSYLAQAYMRHERVPGQRTALYTLNAAITDRAEPCEVLRCAAAWWLGPPGAATLLSTRQLDAFRAGAATSDEDEVRGATGALLCDLTLTIEPGETVRWLTGADTGLDQAEAAALVALINRADAAAEVEDAIACDRVGLRARLAAHDGLSLTGDRGDDDAHRSATLFNLMRGGVLPADLAVSRADFAAWLVGRNRAIAERARDAIAAWPEHLPLTALAECAGECDDPQLERLAGSWLPLAFSRRHGDPSRPWNRFAISLFDRDGRPRSSWQGNWRDIFQNWEALALSFPSALPAMIATFLDASSADGYNPYRVTSEGLDWEVPEDGPWSNFGYWGDHQIVYLTRLLESAVVHHPGWIEARLARCAHASADVPYRIRPYAELLADPHHGVRFDHAAHDAAMARCARLDSDGRLLPGPDGQPLLLSLAEKLLIPVLAKLSNLVPGAGIWLNTRRPEWNDANNALVGWGCSLVTVFQLHRHLALLRRVTAEATELPLSAATAQFLDGLAAALPAANAASCSDAPARKTVMDRLGAIGQFHRERVYARDLGAIAVVPAARLRAFLDAAAAAIDATLAAATRPDGLVDSYTVLDPADLRVRRLDPMLEGQVAAIASGWLTPAAALRLWRAMRASPLWDEQRRTFLLQPDRTVAPFLSRNRLPAAEAEAIGLLAALLVRGDTGMMVRDGSNIRFAAALTNARELDAQLDRLAADPSFAPLVARDRAAVQALYEQVFNHRTFLGRSTTMFGFEGLGSVYWHMVSKLHLALAEAAQHADGDERRALAEALAEVRAGLGPAKTPAEFGAFPCDPYSHTPAHAGAQQPGMTGQVKEEIIARRARLGISVADGCLTFAPARLRRADRLTAPGQFAWVDLDGRERRLAVPAGGLAVTICQVPVLFRPGPTGCSVFHRDGRCEPFSGTTLPPAISQAIFHRTGEIVAVEVGLSAP